MNKKILIAALLFIFGFILFFIIFKNPLINDDNDDKNNKNDYHSSYQKIMDYTCDFFTTKFTLEEYIAMYLPMAQDDIEKELLEENKGKSWEEIRDRQIRIGQKCVTKDTGNLSEGSFDEIQYEVTKRGDKLLECRTYDMYFDNERIYESTACKINSNNKWYFLGFRSLKNQQVKPSSMR